MLQVAYPRTRGFDDIAPTRRSVRFDPSPYSGVRPAGPRSLLRLWPIPVSGGSMQVVRRVGCHRPAYPRARGSDVLATSGTLICYRPIPASGGLTHTVAEPSTRTTAYPRTRGSDIPISSSQTMSTGLSPRPGARRAMLEGKTMQARPIPAPGGSALVFPFQSSAFQSSARPKARCSLTPGYGDGG